MSSRKPKKGNGVPKLGTTPLDKARSIVGKALEKLDDCVDRVSKALDEAKEYDQRLGSHLSYLIEHTTRAMDGLRQLEKHDRQAGEEMSESESLELTAQFLAGLPPEKQAQVLKRLAELSGKDRGALS